LCPTAARAIEHLRQRLGALAPIASPQAEFFAFAIEYKSLARDELNLQYGSRAIE
jgi:hypothetical protein